MLTSGQESSFPILETMVEKFTLVSMEKDSLRALRKFGAILGEGCQLGCNAVTNPGVVLGPRCMVMPNTTVTGVHSSDSTIR